MATFVIYEHLETGEMIVTTSRDEKRAISGWFGNGERDVNEYRRTTHKSDGILLLPHICVRT